jgi:NRPS condensation-like uncharacterized protein
MFSKKRNSFRATLHDGNVHILSFLGLMNIGMVIQFQGKLREKLFIKAVKLSIEKIPVLRARFVKTWWNVRWQVNKNIDISKIVKIEKVKKNSSDHIDFFTTPLDSLNGGQINFLLVQGEKNDSLYIKISHEASDAGGLKEYAYILAYIYSKVAIDNGFKPEPISIESRSLKTVSSKLGFRDYCKIIKRTAKDIVKNSFPITSMTLPVKNVSPEKPVIKTSPLEGKLFFKIYEYSKNNNTTLNDIILAAFILALHKTIAPDISIPLRIIVTADFRRWYLGNQDKKERIANLSGFVYPHFGYSPGQDIHKMIKIVKNEMDGLKNDYPGLGMLAVLTGPGKILPFSWYKGIVRFLGKIGTKLNNIPPALTNMGHIDDKLLKFDNLNIKNAWLVPPVVYPPFVIFSLSGFKKSMMLSAGFYESGVDPLNIKKFFDQMFEYLNDLVEPHNVSDTLD